MREDNALAENIQKKKKKKENKNIKKKKKKKAYQNHIECKADIKKITAPRPITGKVRDFLQLS